MINCFECISCKRNDNKNANIVEHACFCDNINIPNKYKYSNYHRVSSHELCNFFNSKDI